MPEHVFLVLRNAAVFGVVVLLVYAACMWMVKIEDDRLKRRRTP